jgi:hypothetical protein
VEGDVVGFSWIARVELWSCRTNPGRRTSTLWRLLHWFMTNERRIWRNRDGRHCKCVMGVATRERKAPARPKTKGRPEDLPTRRDSPGELPKPGSWVKRRSRCNAFSPPAAFLHAKGFRSQAFGSSSACNNFFFSFPYFKPVVFLDTSLPLYCL